MVENWRSDIVFVFIGRFSSSVIYPAAVNISCIGTSNSIATRRITSGREIAPSTSTGELSTGIPGVLARRSHRSHSLVYRAGHVPTY